ncbi:S-methylmethionine transporter [Helicobacter sp. 13S00482-2]|uniref:amino acid permease n=1 Tax=Helicobacter sp. 13S00482-2 TaxID=1476200 RepID=UPI000BA735FA|nr:amino acid permease [Helicobacter sp. 13S00482-2]PAF54490.1 S-methylmethionine transporter [Helicobacter sp. 13S00482-2]
MKNDNTFARDLKTRHLIMIAFGGAMGTGLFVGTGESLHTAGPLGTIIAYCVASVIVYSIMLSLGELSSYFPNTGSFGDYAHRFISPSAGYMVFWLYWLNWTTTVGIEFIAVGFLMQKWFPNVDTYIWVIVCIIGVFSFNVYRVKIFAESEFTLSLIKVIAVVLFLIFGFGMLFYHLYQDGFAKTFSNFYFHTQDYSGFFPNGITAVFMTILAVNFAFTGTEVMGVAVGETENPAKAVPMAINATLWRLIVFFVGSVFIIATFLPMSDATITQSPFVNVLQIFNVPYVGDVMNFILISALLSTANSGVYASARMIWGLAEKKMLPGFFCVVNKNGIPINGLLFSMLVSLLALLTAVSPAKSVINNLIAVSSLAMMLVWLSVSISQYKFRKWYLGQGKKLDDLPYKTPLTPGIQIFGVIGCVVSIIGAYFDKEQRIAIYGTIIFCVVAFIAYHLTKHIWRKDEKFTSN